MQKRDGLSLTEIAESSALGRCHGKCPAPEMGRGWQDPRARRQRWQMLSESRGEEGKAGEGGRGQITRWSTAGVHIFLQVTNPHLLTPD